MRIVSKIAIKKRKKTKTKNQYKNKTKKKNKKIKIKIKKNGKGKQQCEHLKKFVGNCMNVECILVSSMNRTLETAMIAFGDKISYPFTNHRSHKHQQSGNSYDSYGSDDDGLERSQSHSRLPPLNDTTQTDFGNHNNSSHKTKTQQQQQQQQPSQQANNRDPSNLENNNDIQSNNNHLKKKGHESSMSTNENLKRNSHTFSQGPPYLSHQNTLKEHSRVFGDDWERYPSMDFNKESNENKTIVPWIALECLRERMSPHFNRRETISVKQKKYEWIDFSECQTENDDLFDNIYQSSETYEQMNERALQFYTYLMTRKEKVIAVVSHEGMRCAFVCTHVCGACMRVCVCVCV